jgi:tRNA(His) 5'-end guanylyltransferase
MATMAFNIAFRKNCLSYFETVENFETDSYCGTLLKRINTAMFDSRVFTIPKEEVVNCLIWRQQDATRNSILSVGYDNFSTNQLHGKKCDVIQDMLFTEKDINWNDYPTTLKRGSCCIKREEIIAITSNSGKGFPAARRNRWVIDNEIPIFTQDKDYINKLVMI